MAGMLQPLDKTSVFALCPEIVWDVQQINLEKILKM